MRAEDELKSVIAAGGGVYRHCFFGSADGKPAVLVVFSQEGSNDLLSLPAQYATAQNVRDEITRQYWFGWLWVRIRNYYSKLRKRYNDRKRARYLRRFE